MVGRMEEQRFTLSQEPMAHKLMYHRSRRTVKANGHKLLMTLTEAGWNWD